MFSFDMLSGFGGCCMLRNGKLGVSSTVLGLGGGVDSDKLIVGMMISCKSWPPLRPESVEGRWRTNISPPGYDQFGRYDCENQNDNKPVVSAVLAGYVLDRM